MLQHPGDSFVGRSFGTAGLVNSTIWLPSHAVSFLNSQELGNASPNTFVTQVIYLHIVIAAVRGDIPYFHPKLHIYRAKLYTNVPAN